jgi:hypothetical protein
VGVNDGAMAIGAFDNLSIPQAALKVDDKPFPLGSSGSNNDWSKDKHDLDIVATSTKAIFISLSNCLIPTFFKYVDPNADTTKANDDACQPLTIDLKGKVALVRLGTSGTNGYCGSAVRCGNVAAAGAIGCLIYSPDEATANIAGSPAVPSGSISHEAGKTLFIPVLLLHT